MDNAHSEAKEAVKVTQGDRNSAAEYVSSFKEDPAAPSKSVRNTRDGRANKSLINAFARHREEAEKRVWGNPVLQLVAGYADYTAISDDRWEQGKAAGYRELGEIVAASMPDRIQKNSDVE